LVAVGFYALVASGIVGLEGGAGVAERGGLADFLGFDKAVVALSVAESGDDGTVSFHDLALYY